MRNNTIKMKKSTLAMVVAVPETPLNPKNPAIIAMIKKMTAHVNINPLSSWKSIKKYS
jgi:hypothetical protein